MCVDVCAGSMVFVGQVAVQAGRADQGAKPLFSFCLACRGAGPQACHDGRVTETRGATVCLPIDVGKARPGGRQPHLRARPAAIETALQSRAAAQLASLTHSGAGLYRSVLVCAGLCWSVPVCAGLCRSVLICACLCWSVPVCAGLCWSVPVCAGLCRSVPVCAGLCWSMLVCAGLCRSVPVCAGLCWSVAWAAVCGCLNIVHTDTLRHSSLSCNCPETTPMFDDRRI